MGLIESFKNYMARRNEKIDMQRQRDNTPPREEFYDRRYSSLMRQRDMLQKKIAIPRLEKQIKELDKRAYGNNLSSGHGNILQVPNHFKWDNKKFQRKGGMLT